MMAALGQEVVDPLTGFRGVVVGRVVYLTGCAQVLVQPPAKGDGDWVESRWLDEPRVVPQRTEQLPSYVKAAQNLANREEVRVTGGDRPAPRR